MRKWMLVLLTAVLLVTLALGPMACAEEEEGPTPTPGITPTPTPGITPTPTEAKPTGTLTIALDSVIPRATLLPWEFGYGTLVRFVSLINEFLVYWDRDNDTPIPGLAESWEVSEDGYSITFNLRQGVQFHDGWGEMTSEDVKFTFDKFKEGVRAGAPVQLVKIVERTEAPSPYEFTIYCTEPNAELMLSLVGSTRQSYFTVLCKEYVETVGEEEANANPIGTGPCKLVEAVVNERLVLETVVEDHWRIVPEFAEYVFLEVPEEVTRMAMLMNGEIDASNFTATTAEALVERGYGVKADIGDAYQVVFFLQGIYNPATPTYDPTTPWLDKDVRKAMNLAINRDDIAEHIFKGQATPVGSDTLYPWGDKYAPYPYDPEEAMDLLEQAGYADGFEFTCWDVTCVGAAPEMSEVVEACAGYWSAIGLTVNIRPVWIGDVFYPMMLRTYTDVAYVESRTTYYEPWYGKILDTFGTDGSTCYYYSPEVDALIEELLALTTVEERDLVSEEITDILYDDYALIPIVEASPAWIGGDRIADWGISDGAQFVMYFEYITHSTPLGTFRLFTP